MVRRGNHDTVESKHVPNARGCRVPPRRGSAVHTFKILERFVRTSTSQVAKNCISTLPFRCQGFRVTVNFVNHHTYHVSTVLPGAYICVCNNKYIFIWKIM